MAWCNVQRVYTQTLADLPVVTPTPGSTALSPVECDKADVTVSKSIIRYCYDEFNRQVFSSGSGVAEPAYVSYDGLDRRDRKAVKDPTGADTESRDYAYIGSTELLVSESVNPTGGSSKRHSYDCSKAALSPATPPPTTTQSKSWSTRGA